MASDVQYFGLGESIMKLTRQSLIRGAFALGGASFISGIGGGLPRAIAAEMTKQGGEGEAAAPSTRLILLGTAGGPPLRTQRFEPSNLLVVNGVPYLIDAGYGCLYQLVRAGYKPVDVAALFITHHHLDHDADIAALISFDWVEGRRKKLPIVGPYGTKTMVSAALQYFSVSERVFGNESLNPIAASDYVDPQEVLSDGLIFKDANITVTAAENTHYKTFNHGKDKSFSYRFDTSTRSVVFSGDTGYSEALVKLARDADVLVCEVINPAETIRLARSDSHVTGGVLKSLSDHMYYEHSTPEVVGRMAAEANVKMVVLTHFAPGRDGETDATFYTAGVKKNFKGPVIAGRDLLEL